MTASPYIVSNWVDGPQFYGRAELAATLLDSADRCIYLMGTRRVGKTSLLRHLAARLGPAGLYCDLMQAAGERDGQPCLDEPRLLRLLRRELGRLAERSEPLSATSNTWSRGGDELAAWLEECGWAWEERGLTITLLWDEAEMLARLPSAALMRLRALLQHSRAFRIVICASKGLAAINDRWRETGVSPFLFGFKSHPISGLRDDEADELITRRGTVACPPATAARIRAASGGHPFLIQYLCDRLYHAGSLRHPAPPDLLADPVLADLFRIDIAHLSPGEQSIMRLAAEAGPVSAAALERAAVAGEMGPHFAHGLAQLGYLRALPDGRWIVGNELLLGWLRAHGAPAPSPVSDRASLEVLDDAPPPSDEPLSEREREVLRMLARGLRNSEIARDLIVSENTVKAHIKSIYRKLAVHDRLQAIYRAHQLDLL